MIRKILCSWRWWSSIVDHTGYRKRLKKKRDEIMRRDFGTHKFGTKQGICVFFFLCLRWNFTEKRKGLLISVVHSPPWISIKKKDCFFFNENEEERIVKALENVIRFPQKRIGVSVPQMETSYLPVHLLYTKSPDPSFFFF